MVPSTKWGNSMDSSIIQDAVQAVLATLKGGQTGIIFGAAFLLLTGIVWFFIRKALVNAQIAAAKQQTDQNNQDVRAQDPALSHNDESNMADSQSSLRNNERANLMKMLDALDYSTLLSAAMSKFGSAAVSRVISDIPEFNNVEQREVLCRAAIYKLYGLV